MMFRQFRYVVVQEGQRDQQHQKVHQLQQEEILGLLLLHQHRPLQLFLPPRSPAERLCLDWSLVSEMVLNMILRMLNVWTMESLQLLLGNLWRTSLPPLSLCRSLLLGAVRALTLWWQDQLVSLVEVELETNLHEVAVSPNFTSILTLGLEPI